METEAARFCYFSAGALFLFSICPPSSTFFKWQISYKIIYLWLSWLKSKQNIQPQWVLSHSLPSISQCYSLSLSVPQHLSLPCHPRPNLTSYHQPEFCVVCAILRCVYICMWRNSKLSSELNLNNTVWVHTPSAQTLVFLGKFLDPFKTQLSQIKHGVTDNT